MKRIIHLHIILFFLIIQSCSSYRFKQKIEISTSAKTLSEKVDSIVIHKMNKYNIPGLSIGLVKKDSLIYNKGYGVKSIHKNNQVTKNTIFHTASISKLFTAQAIKKLVTDSILSLDDKITHLLPKLKYKDERVKNITVKSLLTHTSGLPDISNYYWSNNNQSNSSLKNYILNLNLTLKSEPFLQYSYSNLGYNILGYIIEKVSGESFENYLKENVLIPSGMINSDSRYFMIPNSLKTSPHSKNRITKKVYQRKTYPYTREHAPSSTLNSSSLELSKWMISFIQKFEDLNEAKKPIFNTKDYTNFGFQTNRINSKLVIGHFGGDQGYRSYLIMMPDDKLGLVLLANCDYNEDFRQEILHSIVKVMLKNNNR